MDGVRNLTSNTVGFCLLPFELIHDILLRLALPDIARLNSVSRTIASVIADDDFRCEYNDRSIRDTWLFVYTKRSIRDSVLHGYTDRSNRWFKFPVAEYLFPVVPPGEDLYFLTASGGFFLFASNNRREVIAVNLMLKTVKKIPPSPLGPRGTSSWRRSGLKLIAGSPGSGRFRFLFAELYENRPVLYEYNSEVDTWRSYEARESVTNQPCECPKERVILSVIHRRNDSILLEVKHGNEVPVVLRPRFDAGAIQDQERLSIGFSMGNVIDRLHVYGDGYMVIVKSKGVDNGIGGARMRVFTCIEVWGLSLEGRNWELVSKVPNELLDKLRKPYGVMMGCLEERDGIVKFVLVANYGGLWELVWLCYDLRSGCWKWVPLAEFRNKGLNLAGATLSSGPTL